MFKGGVPVIHLNKLQAAGVQGQRLTDLESLFQNAWGYICFGLKYVWSFWNFGSVYICLE